MLKKRPQTALFSVLLVSFSFVYSHLCYAPPKERVPAAEEAGEVTHYGIKRNTLKDAHSEVEKLSFFLRESTRRQHYMFFVREYGVERIALKDLDNPRLLPEVRATAILIDYWKELSDEMRKPNPDLDILSGKIRDTCRMSVCNEIDWDRSYKTKKLITGKGLRGLSSALRHWGSFNTEMNKKLPNLIGLKAALTQCQTALLGNDEETQDVLYRSVQCSWYCQCHKKPVTIYFDNARQQSKFQEELKKASGESDFHSLFSSEAIHGCSLANMSENPWRIKAEYALWRKGHNTKDLHVSDIQPHWFSNGLTCQVGYTHISPFETDPANSICDNYRVDITTEQHEISTRAFFNLVKSLLDQIELHTVNIERARDRAELERLLVELQQVRQQLQSQNDRASIGSVDSDGSERVASWLQANGSLEEDYDE